MMGGKNYRNSERKRYQGAMCFLTHTTLRRIAPLSFILCALMIFLTGGNTAFGQTAFIYWGEQGTTDAIKRVDISTGIAGPVETIISTTTEMSGPRGIALDRTTGKMYIASSFDNKIIEATLDGSGTTNWNFLTLPDVDSPKGLAIDTATSKLYWGDEGGASQPQIKVANTDGTGVSNVINASSDPSAIPEGVAIDTPAGKLYWVNRVSNSIYTANTDGTGLTALFTTGVGNNAKDLALDLTGGKMYWSTRSDGDIKVANMDGTGGITTLFSGLTTPFGVAIDSVAGKIYWSERNAGTIKRSNLDGTGVETLLTGLTSPRHVALLFSGGDFYWDDTSGNGLWTTATNWVDDVAPTTGADVFFENDYGSGAESVNVNANQDVQSLNFDNPTAYTLNNNTITLSDNGGNVGIFVDDINGTPGSPITHTINSNISLGNDATIDNKTTGANTRLEINGNIALGSGALTFNSDGGDIEIAGTSVISGPGGAGGITKTGTGDLTISSSGTMTFTANVNINAGTYTMQNATALGDSIVGSTAIASGGSLIIELSGNNIVDEALTVSGTGSSGQGAIVHNNLTSGTTTMRGDSRFNGGTLISSTAGTLSFDADTQRLQGGITTFDTSTGSIEFTGTSQLYGTGGFTKTGAGTMTLSSSTANTYTGTTTVSAGVLEIQNITSLGDTTTGTVIGSGGTLELNISGSTTLSESSYSIAGTGSSGQGALTQTSGGSTFVSGSVQLTSDALISNTSGTLSFGGANIDLNNQTLTLNAAGSNNILFSSGSSIISGSGNIIKTGSGTIWYSSDTANTYGGTTTINEGTLLTFGNSGVTAFAGDIIINGGTLNLRSNNRISDTANMTLNGGTLELSSNANETLGTLTLSASSEINLNPGNNHILSFADSSGTSWTGGTQLSIENWEGNAISGGGNHQLIFSSAGLTAGQLYQVKFINPLGFSPGTYDAKFIGNELVPAVPEPSTIIVGSLALLFIGYRERKRLLRFWKWIQIKYAT